eukprot:357162-Chlamydomonas_euryale.AAC.9
MPQGHPGVWTLPACATAAAIRMLPHALNHGARPRHARSTPNEGNERNAHTNSSTSWQCTCIAAL